MVDDLGPDEGGIGRSKQIAYGLRMIAEEIGGHMHSTEVQKADEVYRRGVCFLVREAANFLHTFAVLQFTHEITQPEWATNFEEARDFIARLSESPRDVPAYYYAFASDLFDYCARRQAKALRREEWLGKELRDESGRSVRLEPAEDDAPERARA